MEQSKGRGAKPNLKNWRRIVGQRVGRLTPDEARAALDRIRADGLTIYHADVRALTGGINSQSVNTYVTRQLAVRCGLIGKEWA